MSSKTDTLKHLKFLFGDQPDGKIELRYLNEDANARVTKFYDTPEQAAKDAKKQNGNSLNVYPGLATRRDSTSGKASNLKSVRVVWVDIDPELPEGTSSADAMLKITEAKDAARARIAAFRHRPSMIVDSGGGLHVYWSLAEPLDLTTAEAQLHLKRITTGLALALQGDLRACDPARILRLAGTVNYPKAKKRARGRTPAPCSILAEDATSYTLEDFHPERLAGEAHGAKVTAEAVPIDGVTPWSGEIPPRVGGWLQTDQALRDRFDGEPGDHSDQSARRPRPLPGDHAGAPRRERGGGDPWTHGVQAP